MGQEWKAHNLLICFKFSTASYLEHPSLSYLDLPYHFSFSVEAPYIQHTQKSKVARLTMHSGMDDSPIMYPEEVLSSAQTVHRTCPLILNQLPNVMSPNWPCTAQFSGGFPPWSSKKYARVPSTSDQLPNNNVSREEGISFS